MILKVSLAIIEILWIILFIAAINNVNLGSALFYGVLIWIGGFGLFFLNYYSPKKTVVTDEKPLEDEVVEELTKIKNYEGLIHRFLYQCIENATSKIENIVNKASSLQDSVDTSTRTYWSIVKSKKSALFEYMALVLEKDSLPSKYSNFISKDLTKLGKPLLSDFDATVSRIWEETQTQKKYEKQKQRMEKMKELGSDLFGEEIVPEEIEEKLEELKPIGQVIDDLLDKYAEWETGQYGKKEQ